MPSLSLLSRLRFRWQSPFGLAAALAVGSLVAGCAAPVQEPLELREQVVAVTAAHELLTFNAARPDHILERRPLQGLSAGDKLVGIDFRVARGVLYALAQSGRLYTLELGTGQLTPVGAGTPPVALKGSAFGVDFNPAADRVRVVSNLGQNLRLHPDTGAQVDGQPDVAGVQPDGPLRYADGDAQAGSVPRIVAAGYTYNKDNEKITTNYAIDAQAGHLVMQGSPEGVTPVVSPNTGLLRTVGPLGVHAFDHASLDIDDVKNNAYLVTGRIGSTTSRLYVLDLKTGQAQLIGFVGPARERDRLGAVLAMAIQP